MNPPLDPTVMWLTWRQLFAKHRIWFALAFALAPLLFTLMFRLVADDGDAARLDFFITLNRQIVIGVLLPLAAVVFGTTAFGGEVDDGTLVYLLVKPVQRWQIVLSKFVVAVASTVGVMIPAILFPWFVLRSAGLPARAPLAFLVAACAGAAVYCALFLALGLLTRRALVAGLVYVIGFESILSRGLIGLKSFSVREMAVAIAQAASGGTIVVPDYVVPMSTVWWMGTIMLVGATAWTLRTLVRYELAEQL
jgi:ABC-2 type transport system permease protein